MPSEIERICQVEELWTSRLVMEPIANAKRMADYVTLREMRRTGDKVDVVVSRAAPCITKQAALAAEEAAKSEIPTIPRKARANG